MNYLQILEHTKLYAGMGWRIFPCKSNDKTPMIKNWQSRASNDSAIIKSWWQRWPDANIAICTGGGLEVLDVDYDGNGHFSMRELREHYDFPTVPTVETSNGCHHYFINSGKDIGNKVKFLNGLDWRGKGGYIIAPPSIHPSGSKYIWSIRPCK